jgi:hypothetical protein
LKVSDFCKKFKQHFFSRGLFHVFGQVGSALIFVKPKLENTEQVYFIQSGPLRLIFNGWGVQIYWLDKQLTTNVGLNIGVNTLGMWTDSSKAQWQLIEKKKDLLKLRVSFNEIPLVQVWSIKIIQPFGFVWEIESQNTEWMHINEFRVAHLLSPEYIFWFCGYQQGNFCRFDEKQWRDFNLSQPSSLFTGVRFSREETNFPALLFEATDSDSQVLIQNSSARENARLIGFNIAYSPEKCNFLAGTYQIFKVTAQIFEKTAILDSQIEHLRQKALGDSFGRNKSVGIHQYLKILLVNLPWQINENWGVRAGSRWPHIKNQSEGQYMPFPFFLAQAASLLQKNKVDVQIIDAVAQQMPEEEFMEQLLNKKIDYLVDETSIPSLSKDMEILKKIAGWGKKLFYAGPTV